MIRPVNVILRLLGLLCLYDTAGSTEYKVRLRMARWGQINGKLFLELINSNSATNTLVLNNLPYYGGRISTDGGPFQGVGSQTVTMSDGFGRFHNKYEADVTGILWGSSDLTFSFEITDPQRGSGIEDRFSCFLVGANGISYLRTMDPLGTNALFSVGLDGTQDGELIVYEPLQFVAPDSLIFDADNITGIIGGPKLGGPLKVLSFGPNPINDHLKVQLEVPKGGSQLEANILDISGKIVRRISSEWVSEGEVEISWDGRGKNGILVSSGVYFMTLRANRTMIVKKIAVTR